MDVKWPQVLLVWTERERERERATRQTLAGTTREAVCTHVSLWWRSEALLNGTDKHSSQVTARTKTQTYRHTDTHRGTGTDAGTRVAITCTHPGSWCSRWNSIDGDGRGASDRLTAWDGAIVGRITSPVFMSTTTQSSKHGGSVGLMAVDGSPNMTGTGAWGTDNLVKQSDARWTRQRCPHTPLCTAASAVAPTAAPRPATATGAQAWTWPARRP